MHYFDLTESHFITNKMKIDLDMLGMLMLHRVAGQVLSAYVVAEHNGGTLGRSAQFM
jgi:hypothetical protein